MAVTALRSSAGELVPLTRPVLVGDDVTSWLAGLVDAMVSTLGVLTRECFEAALACMGKGGSPGWGECVKRYPSQVLVLVESLTFARDVEEALSVAASPPAAREASAAAAAPALPLACLGQKVSKLGRLPLASAS